MASHGAGSSGGLTRYQQQQKGRAGNVRVQGMVERAAPGQKNQRRSSQSVVAEGDVIDEKFGFLRFKQVCRT